MILARSEPTTSQTGRYGPVGCLTLWSVGCPGHCSYDLTPDWGVYRGRLNMVIASLGWSATDLASQRSPDDVQGPGRHANCQR